MLEDEVSNLNKASKFEQPRQGYLKLRISRRCREMNNLLTKSAIRRSRTLLKSLNTNI